MSEALHQLEAYRLALVLARFLGNSARGDGLTPDGCTLALKSAVEPILHQLEALPAVEDIGCWVKGAEHRVVAGLLAELKPRQERGADL